MPGVSLITERQMSRGKGRHSPTCFHAIHTHRKVSSKLSASNRDQACCWVVQAGRRVMALDVALLVAGSGARGELQSRIARLLADIAAAGDVILM